MAIQKAGLGNLNKHTVLLIIRKQQSFKNNQIVPVMQYNQIHKMMIMIIIIVIILPAPGSRGRDWSPMTAETVFCNSNEYGRDTVASQYETKISHT